MSVHPEHNPNPPPPPGSLPPEEEARLKGMDYAEASSVQQIHAAITREKAEPEEGNEPLSLVVIGLICVVIMWGGYYFGANHAQFRPEIHDGTRVVGVATFGGAADAAAATAGGGAPKEFDMVAFGKRNFTANCAACHQASGLGQAGVYPPLAGSEWVLEPNPKRIIAIVLHGAQGPFNVKGNSYNNIMTPWGASLNDKKIAAILTYIRQEWGNSAPPVTEPEVAAVRTEFASRTAAWTEPELKAISLDQPILAASPAAPAPAAAAAAAPAAPPTPPPAAPPAPAPAAPR